MINSNYTYFCLWEYKVRLIFLDIVYSQASLSSFSSLSLHTVTVFHDENFCDPSTLVVSLKCAVFGYWVQLPWWTHVNTHTPKLIRQASYVSEALNVAPRSCCLLASSPHHAVCSLDFPCSESAYEWELEILVFLGLTCFSIMISRPISVVRKTNFFLLKEILFHFVYVHHIFLIQSLLTCTWFDFVTWLFNIGQWTQVW